MSMITWQGVVAFFGFSGFLAFAIYWGKKHPVESRAKPKWSIEFSEQTKIRAQKAINILAGLFGLAFGVWLIVILPSVFPYVTRMLLELWDAFPSYDVLFAISGSTLLLAWFFFGLQAMAEGWILIKKSLRLKRGAEVAK